MNANPDTQWVSICLYWSIDGHCLWVGSGIASSLDSLPVHLAALVANQTFNARGKLGVTAFYILFIAFCLRLANSLTGYFIPGRIRYPSHSVSLTFFYKGAAIQTIPQH